MATKPNNTIEFEPGAALPLVLAVGPEGGQPGQLYPRLFVSVYVNEACYELVGIYSEQAGGYQVDLNPLEAAPLQEGEKYNAYIYGEDADGVSRLGSFRVKPVGGCVWKAS